MRNQITTYPTLSQADRILTGSTMKCVPGGFGMRGARGAGMLTS